MASGYIKFLTVCVLVLAMAGCKTNVSSSKSGLPVGSGTSGTVTPPATGAPGSPNPPTGLSATGISSTSIQLDFTDNATDETGFNLYRASVSGGPYVLITTIAANGGTGAASYVDTGLTANTTYYYRLSAVNLAGESAATAEVNATTLVSGAPSNLVAQALASGNIRLTWVDNATTETAFLIERSFTGAAGTFATVAFVPADQLQFTDSGLFPSTTYYYRVTAVGLVPVAVSNTDADTTFSGAWIGISGSASGSGISNTAGNSSSVSVASSDNGLHMVVWQEDVRGIDQIYAAIYSDGAASRGWAGIVTNATVDTITYDDDTVPTLIESVSYLGDPALSNNGRGISLCSGDCQNPQVIFYTNGGNRNFVIAWQEQNLGSFQINARIIRNVSYNALTGKGFYEPGVTTAGYVEDCSGANAVALMSGMSRGCRANTVGVLNGEEDDSYVMTGSSWSLSNDPVPTDAQGYATINPRIAVNAAGERLFAVFQAFSGARWQIFGTITDLTTVDNNQPGDAETSEIVAGTNTGGGVGISNVAVGSNAIHPDIAVLDNNNVYTVWQEYDNVTVPNNWEIRSSYYNGAAFAASVLVNAANTGDSRSPRIALTSANLPVVAWEDNSNGNKFNIYARLGDATGAVWSTIFDGNISSGDTTTDGLSELSTGQAQLPTLATYGTDIFVSWQDSTDGIWNIFVKHFSTLVPGEPQAWKSMADSDVAPGISVSVSGSAVKPSITVNPDGVVSCAWTAASSAGGQYEAFLRRW